MELISYLKNKGIEHKLSLFEKYALLLEEWDKKFNITAVNGKEEIFKRHFADSLLGAEFIIGKTVLDIGAGGGFPAAPIAIVQPDRYFVMADALNKRVTFLKELIKELELTNAEAIHSRAEELDKKKKYDCSVSRAVGKINTLCEYTLPFLKIGGRMIAYKSTGCGKEVEEAQKAIAVLGGKLRGVEKRRLDEETERCFVIIEKIKETPAKFPRGGNKPKSEPIS